MKLWKRIEYFFSSKAKLISFEVLLRYKTESDMTLASVRKEITIDFPHALARKYIRDTDWDNWNICNKVRDDISDKMNFEAEEMLKKVRKGSGIKHRIAGVWVEGKHIVEVDWYVAYPEFEPLTFEEYCKLNEKK